MRHQGRITTWKDEKGFGFVTPKANGPQVFVHINAFSNRPHRPAVNELVSYELMIDENGRAQAANVAFAGVRPPPDRQRNDGNIFPLFAGFFLLLVAASVLAGKLPRAVLVLYLSASMIAFVAYAIDKSAARNKRWRTRESTLHLFAFLGGWPGALAGQRLLRHKSGKTSFQAVFRLTVLLNCGALGWLCSPYGATVLRSVLGPA